ncbi:winged helix-turn-helix transcriptional regulator [Clostridium sp. UBA6640]|uniref:winged helix-turn-helix transcriptional regulator n=1 Tax=Clostridium sp. UBA6640 TaxID=1946370 RepID=UPI0025BABE6A|nr:helix-turn-helix domain-containing protein [Clostridium sp. UBA6640]
MARFKFQVDTPPEEKEEICPLTITQNVIAGRWKIIILWYLSQRTRRFNELQRLLPDISKGTLTIQLRELEEDGMVHREVYKEVPPKVEYSLTAQGKRFIPVLDAMGDWGKEYIKKKQKEHNY